MESLFTKKMNLSSSGFCCPGKKAKRETGIWTLLERSERTWNMRMRITVIPIIIDTLETVQKGLAMGLK